MRLHIESHRWHGLSRHLSTYRCRSRSVHHDEFSYGTYCIRNANAVVSFTRIPSITLKRAYFTHIDHNVGVLVTDTAQKKEPESAYVISRTTFIIARAVFSQDFLCHCLKIAWHPRPHAICKTFWLTTLQIEQATPHISKGSFKSNVRRTFCFSEFFDTAAPFGHFLG